LRKRLGKGVVNKPFNRFRIDVATRHRGVRIAIEYDSWYWHAHKAAKDAKRTTELVAAGWKVLRIKGNLMVPLKALLLKHLEKLSNTPARRTTIRMRDWGHGPTADPQRCAALMPKKAPYKVPS